MYKAKRYRFQNAIEVEEYHTARYGAPGMIREQKKRPTKEQIERQNRYNREKVCRRKLRANFDVKDYFSDLTYRREERPPDMKTAQKQFSKFIREVRREYRKRGKELKWIRNIEVGTRNGWHIHMVINRIPDTDIILADLWKYGKVINELMYEKGEFKDLAAYITKTPKTDPRLKEASYSCSRNLPVPEPQEKVYMRWKTWGKIRIPKGWYLDKDSFAEGVNPVTGYKYRHYTLLRLERKRRGS